LGPYVSLLARWRFQPLQTTALWTEIRSYPSLPGLVLVNTTLEGSLDQTALNSDSTSLIQFPAFDIPGCNTTASLGYTFWHGLWPQPQVGVNLTVPAFHAQLPERHDGPVLFTASNVSSAAQSLLVGPLSDPAVQLVTMSAKGKLAWGPSSYVNRVESGYSYQAVLVAGTGAHDTLQRYGAFLQQWYGDQVRTRMADPTLTKLSFWTDNGAYLFWDTAG
jgi:hypothetical protein